MAAVLFALAATQASGQTVRDEAQRLLDERRARERTEAFERKPAHIGGSGEVPPSALPPDISAGAADEPAFLIRRILLEGDTLLGESGRGAIVAPFLGQRLGPRGIDRLLRAISAAYFERGYLTTRAYLGAQNLADGLLVVTVVPGVVERVDLAGGGHAAPLEKGQPLRLAEIEQAVDQINRLRSRRAEAQILPGQSTGGSVIAIDTHPQRPWRFLLGGDNYGQSATGINRRRLGVEVDNALGLWDAWALTSVESADARSELLAASLPVGYGTASYAYAQAKSRVELLAGIVSRTESASHTIGWNQVIARDQHTRHALDLALVLRDTRRRLDDIELTPQQQSVVRLAGNTLWRGQRGALNAELGYSRGIKRFGGDGDVANLPASAPHYEFEKWDANLSLAWTLGTDLAWRTQVVGQSARTGLLGQEQIYLGGAASVRGFKEGIVSGDRGALARNELQWAGALPRAALADGWRLDPYAFLDAGIARQLASGDNQRLASLGLGLRAGWKDTSADLAWGRPQTAPAGIPRHDYLHFSLNLQF
jgi:hemolysin activation/secretion protein